MHLFLKKQMAFIARSTQKDRAPAVSRRYTVLIFISACCYMLWLMRCVRCMYQTGALPPVCSLGLRSEAALNFLDHAAFYAYCCIVLAESVAVRIVCEQGPEPGCIVLFVRIVKVGVICKGEVICKCKCRFT